MLELYIISKTQSTPEWPEKLDLKLAGRLDSKVFHNLQKKGIIEEEFNYFEDFRWNAKYIKNKLEQLKHSVDTDLVKLRSLLAPAVSISAELVAFCD
ncbi:MAG: hypothetical protein ACI8ZM_003904 [Crocinitomix sp.]|jgi:hypothetical protein